MGGQKSVTLGMREGERVHTDSLAGRVTGIRERGHGSIDVASAQAFDLAYDF